jgi:hypothetical protein
MVWHPILSQKIHNQCRNIMCPFGHPKIKAFTCRHDLLRLEIHIIVFSSQPSLLTFPNQSSLWKGPQHEGITST